ncbi:DUF6286 domain-containing Asp23/Gls24 family envelope stress response protein [Streptomyces sp. YJ-C3]
MTAPAPALRGTTVLSDRAVRKVAQGAAREAVTVAARDVSASATVAGRRASVGVQVALPYPTHLSTDARRVQEHVTSRTRALTGLQVPTVRVVVSRLAPDAAPPSPPADAEAVAGPAVRPPRRWWSQRRRPMGVLSGLAAAAAVVCTVDVFRVHAAGAQPWVWRRSAVTWLAGHGPGDPTVTLAGVGAALVGAWLLFMVVTPGRRRQLTLGTAGEGWSAAIDRPAVAALLRDAVADVPGTQDIKVRCGRRTVKVRGEVAFGDCASARAEARRTATDVLDSCGLRRPLRLRLVLRPADTWQAPAADAGQNPEPHHATLTTGEGDA